MVSPVGCRHSGLLRKRVGSVCVRPRDSQEPLPMAPAAGRSRGCPACSLSLWSCRPRALPRGRGSAGLRFPTTSALAGSASGTLSSCSPAARALERASCPGAAWPFPPPLSPRPHRVPDRPSSLSLKSPLHRPPHTCPRTTPERTPGCPAALPLPFPCPPCLLLALVTPEDRGISPSHLAFRFGLF